VLVPTGSDGLRRPWREFILRAFTRAPSRFLRAVPNPGSIRNPLEILRPSQACPFRVSQPRLVERPGVGRISRSDFETAAPFDTLLGPASRAVVV